MVVILSHIQAAPHAWAPFGMSQLEMWGCGGSKRELGRVAQSKGPEHKAGMAIVILSSLEGGGQTGKGVFLRHKPPEGAGEGFAYTLLPWSDGSQESHR